MANKVAIVKYKQRPKSRTQFAPKTVVGDATVPPENKLILIIQSTQSVSEFAIAEKARNASTRSGQVLRIFKQYGMMTKKRRSRLRRGKKRRGRRTQTVSEAEISTGVSQLLERSEILATVQPTEIQELKTDDGTRYPLRIPVTLARRMVGGSARVYFPKLDALASLKGEGKSDKRAIRDFTAKFHRLVESHWRKPQHLQTDADEEINRFLEHLIDWERFHQLNPIEQPLWGRVDEKLPNGSIRVCWMIGPKVERGEETTLRPRDACSALKEIDIGQWFYGSGKVYPTSIEWLTQPIAVPDPEDREAIRAAWDLIPRNLVKEAEGWPRCDKE